MGVTRITADEAKEAFDTLGDWARSGPVVITKEGRDSLVVIGAEEWERLRQRDRRVGLTADLPEEWVEAIRGAEVPEECGSLDAELT